MQATTEQILDVTHLAPAVKHSTIFARIAELEDGDSLVLHVDHDPAPLRHQLGHTHQDTIRWEYLENNEAGRNILDVTTLPPAVKHSTIFERVDALQSGESLTIHNDHDPKPLYYQMQGEMGDVFTWEYLEQGPAWWRVKITKRPLAV